MCDVSSDNRTCFLEKMTLSQTCKYPEKTKRRISKLIPKEKICDPAPVPPIQKVHAQPLGGGWKRNFREGDDDDDFACPPPVLNRHSSRSTGSSSAGDHTLYGDHKRPVPDRSSVNHKKVRVAYAPALGKLC